MLQTASILKSLPALDETPSWLPADIVADAVLEETGINPNENTEKLSRDPDAFSTYKTRRLFGWLKIYCRLFVVPG